MSASSVVPTTSQDQDRREVYGELESVDALAGYHWEVIDGTDDFAFGPAILTVTDEGTFFVPAGTTVNTSCDEFGFGRFDYSKACYVRIVATGDSVSSLRVLTPVYAQGADPDNTEPELFLVQGFVKDAEIARVQLQWGGPETLQWYAIATGTEFHCQDQSWNPPAIPDNNEELWYVLTVDVSLDVIVAMECNIGF